MSYLRQTSVGVEPCRGVHGGTFRKACAILTDSEGAASLLSFPAEILLPHAHDRLGPFIAEHAADEEIEGDFCDVIPNTLPCRSKRFWSWPRGEEFSLLRPWARYDTHCTRDWRKRSASDHCEPRLVCPG